MKRLLCLSLFAVSFAAYGQTSSPTQTVITWDATPPEVLSVTVERKVATCAAPGTFGSVGSPVVAPARVFTDAAVTAGTTYCYRAQSNGAGGQKSVYSNTVEHTVPFPVPSAPQNLRIQ